MQLKGYLFAALIGVGIASVGAVVGMRQAPTPAALASTDGLDAALKRSATSNRPVLAFATAEWCGPCQKLKRGALADERVQSAIAAGFEAVTLEETTTQGSADIRRLPVTAFPTLVVLKGDQVLGTLTGVRSTESVLAFLSEHAK